MSSDPSRPRFPLPAILAVFMLPLAGAYALYRFTEPTRAEKTQMEALIAQQQREGKSPLQDEDDDDN